jgi:hypothetical protein
MKGNKRFALALVLLIFTAVTVPAQPRRTGRQSRVKKPVGTAAYIRISSVVDYKDNNSLEEWIGK